MVFTQCFNIQMAGHPTVWHVVVNISENLPNYIHLQSYSCMFMKVHEGTGTAVVLIYNHSTQYSTSIIRNFNYIQISSNSQIQSQFRIVELSNSAHLIEPGRGSG